MDTMHIERYSDVIYCEIMGGGGFSLLCKFHFLLVNADGISATTLLGVCAILYCVKSHGRRLNKLLYFIAIEQLCRE